VVTDTKFGKDCPFANQPLFKKPGIGYSKPMELEFFFRDSAFKHGLDERDIRQAFETSCYMGQYGNRENVYLLLGFDMKANQVEIMYNEIGENGVNVFHAMPCQSRFYHLFKQGGTL
jgi:hypothetical protein